MDLKKTLTLSKRVEGCHLVTGRDTSATSTANDNSYPG